MCWIGFIASITAAPGIPTHLFRKCRAPGMFGSSFMLKKTETLLLI
jgi:hypothetical protein